MARYKDYVYSQGIFIPIHLDRQILPGTFDRQVPRKPRHVAGQGAQLKQYFLPGKPRPVAGELHYSLHSLIDNEIDLSIFDTRYRNDEMGAPAYDPAILFKIIKIRNCITIRGSLDERK
jgi:hypothetical protein